MGKNICTFCVVLAFVLVACEASGQYTFDMVQYDDAAYPDNPDIGFRSAAYDDHYFISGEIKHNNADVQSYDMTFRCSDNTSILLKDIDLKTWVPTIPLSVRSDAYLSYLAVVNQEWNRNQVAFKAGSFDTENKRIIRVDLARNCLNAYLWEVILFVNDDGQTLPFAHGWFEFPRGLYQELFTKINVVSFDKYAPCLENWVDPPSKKIKISQLRKIVITIDITYTDQCEKMYLLLGERAKKRKEIIHPVSFNAMRDLQSDNTTFATFVQPGLYDRSNPRKTQLGRIRHLTSIQMSQTTHLDPSKTLHEIVLDYEDDRHARKTKLVISGIDFNDIPVLSDQEIHKGWQNSMGWGNHSFYENYDQHISIDPKTNPYFAYLSDQNDKWLDSHTVGIDGPLMYFSDDQKSILHLSLLSFERHAIVAEYVIRLSKKKY